ncbi:MAG TPA: glycosyltransferase [Terriglobales bacterium]|nr:glycosyltransferase [Terriglobales bacterium]
MRIARVIARLNVGGPAIQAVLLTHALQYQGHATVLACGNLPIGEGSAEYLAAEAGVPIYRIDGLSRSISLFDDLRAFLQILRLIHRERPDIIHTHTAKAGTLGRLAAWLSRVPAIHTFHGHVFHGYFSSWKTRAVIAMERFLAKHTAAIVAISESQKRDLSTVYQIAPANKIHVVRLGFNLSPFAAVFQRRLRQVSPGAVRCGWVGRLTAIKDPCLFTAIAREWQRGQLAPASFTVFGDGELRPEVAAAAAELGNEFQFAGWQRDTAAIYECLDLLVLTSRNEGTPVAVIEAMASGCAVIAADVGGVADLMGEPKEHRGQLTICAHGLLVRNRDPQSFAAALAVLANDEPLRTNICEAAHQHVMSHYGQERLVAEIIALYESVLQRRATLAAAGARA